MTSSRPYFLRALYDWIVDNSMTPHLMVDATHAGVSVPQQYVKDGKIVLNVAPDAIVNLSMANDWVNFDARFSGVVHRIRLPIMSVGAIYAVENGRGMVFDQEELGGDDTDGAPPTNIPPSSSKSNKSGPSLKVVK